MTAPPTSALESFGFSDLADHRRPKKAWPSEPRRGPGWIDPDLTMPGYVSPGIVAGLGRGCGDLYTSYCTRDETHETERGRKQCTTRGCGQCARDRTKEANRAPPGAEDDEERHWRFQEHDAVHASHGDAARKIFHGLEDLLAAKARDPDFPRVGAWLKKRIRELQFKTDFFFESERRRPLPYGNGRLDTFGHRMDLRLPRWYHFVVSPKPRRVGYDRVSHRDMAQQAIKIARRAGARDFIMVAHAFRHDDTDQNSPEHYNQPGLHFHFLAISRWIMQGPALRPKRGRPPNPVDPAKPLNAYDGKIWGPLRSAREVIPDWRFRIIWFAEPVQRGIMIKNLKHGGTYVKSGPAFSAYIGRLANYLFHHATYYKAHYHTVPHPYGKKGEFRLARTKGRHATPAVMSYGRMRESGPPTEDDAHVAWVDKYGDGELLLWRAKEALYGSRKPRCPTCGAPTIEVYDDSLCVSAQRQARVMVAA